MQAASFVNAPSLGDVSVPSEFFPHIFFYLPSDSALPVPVLESV